MTTYPVSYTVARIRDALELGDLQLVGKWVWELEQALEDDTHPVERAYEIETNELPHDLSRQVPYPLDNISPVVFDPRTPAEIDADQHARETMDTRESDRPR